MLVVERDLQAGIPQTAVLRFAPSGIVWHWTAGGTGRAGADSTKRHFINTRGTVNASYHILLFREGEKTVAQWIVPSDRASHSMNPGNAFVPKTNSAREQARFAEVRRILGTKARDPNAAVISVSFCGMPADLAAAMKDPVFVADVRELAAQLIARPTIIDRPHFGHGWIQPVTRYETDATTGGADLLIETLYAPAKAPGGTMADIDTFALERITIDGGARIRSAPSPDAPVLFTTPPDRTTMVTSVGTKNGFHAYWNNAGRWAYTSTEANVLKREPLPITVDAPSGFTQAQVDTMVEEALAPYKRRIGEFKELSTRALS